MNEQDQESLTFMKKEFNKYLISPKQSYLDLKYEKSSQSLTFYSEKRIQSSTIGPVTKISLTSWFQWLESLGFIVKKRFGGRYQISWDQAESQMTASDVRFMMFINSLKAEIAELKDQLRR